MRKPRINSRNSKIAKKYWLVVSLILLYNVTFGQTRKQYKWSASVSVNSIHAQIEVPIATLIGGTSPVGAPMVIDADGNILGRGDRFENSYSLSFIPKYRVSDDFLIRAEFMYTNLSESANFNSISYTTPREHSIDNIQVNFKLQKYSAGILWQFASEKVIESYCGLIASYQNYGQIITSIYHESRRSEQDTLQSINTIAENIPGGFAVGIGALIGFNIFFNRHISVGAEFSSSIMHYELGGTAIAISTGQSVPSYFYNFETVYTNSYTGIKITKILSSFNICYWF
jgi:hypothetical protein